MHPPRAQSHMLASLPFHLEVLAPEQPRHPCFLLEPRLRGLAGFEICFLLKFRLCFARKSPSLWFDHLQSLGLPAFDL